MGYLQLARPGEAYYIPQIGRHSNCSQIRYYFCVLCQQVFCCLVCLTNLLLKFSLKVIRKSKNILNAWCHVQVTKLPPAFALNFPLFSLVLASILAKQSIWTTAMPTITVSEQTVRSSQRDTELAFGCQPIFPANDAGRTRPKATSISMPNLLSFFLFSNNFRENFSNKFGKQSRQQNTCWHSTQK